MALKVAVMPSSLSTWTQPSSVAIASAATILGSKNYCLHSLWVTNSKKRQNILAGSGYYSKKKKKKTQKKAVKW